MSGKYDDMLRMPHHVSPTRPRLSLHDRAAQFKPFSALTGYEAVIRETGRLTDARAELDEDARAELDWRLQLLSGILSQEPEVTVTYFQPDGKKAGGAYRTVVGAVRKIDEHEEVLVMADGTSIPVADLFALEGAWLPPVD